MEKEGAVDKHEVGEQDDRILIEKERSSEGQWHIYISITKQHAAAHTASHAFRPLLPTAWRFVIESGEFDSKVPYHLT